MWQAHELLGCGQAEARKLPSIYLSNRMVKVERGAMSSSRPATRMYAPVTKAAIAGLERLRAATEKRLGLTGPGCALSAF